MVPPLPDGEEDKVVENGSGRALNENSRKPTRRIITNLRPSCVHKMSAGCGKEYFSVYFAGGLKNCNEYTPDPSSSLSGVPLAEKSITKCTTFYCKSSPSRSPAGPTRGIGVFQVSRVAHSFWKQEQVGRDACVLSIFACHPSMTIDCASK